MAKKVEIEEKEIEAPYTLPDGWRWVRLGDVAKFERGITFPASAKESEKTENNIPCLRTANVQENIELDDLIYVDKSFMKNNLSKLIQKNDIVFSSANSRELVGKSSFIGAVPYPMTFGGFLLCIRTNNSENKFLFYYLRLHFLLGRFMGKSTQTTNIANINTESLSNIIIPLPPTLAEQQRIVNRIESMFSKLDEAKEKAQDVVDSFENRKAAILHKAFTGELTAKWRKENGISDDSWEEKTLGELCNEIKIGPFGSLLHEEDYIENGIPLINPKHISHMRIIPDYKTSVSVQKGKDLEPYKIYENDIILGRRGEMGRCAPVGKMENGWLCGTGSMILRLKSEYLAYLYSLFIASHSSVLYLEENAVGSTLKNLNEKIVKKLPLPSIPFPEQQEIVRILDAALEKERTSKETAEQVLEQIDLLKKSILARAFRGEL